MSKYITSIVIILSLQLLSFDIQAQEVPQFIHYQGNLASANGNAVNDNLQMIFSIYDQETAGSLLWGPEVHNSVVVEAGLFNVQLGTITALSADLFRGSRYLEISVGGETLTPRQRIGSIAYALKSQTVAAGAVVKSINSITDDVTLQPGNGIDISQASNTLTVNVGSDLFGAWQERDFDTVYSALTNGLVLGLAEIADGSDGSAVLSGFTDSNNPPSNFRARASRRRREGISINQGGSFLMPVRKGDNWQVTHAGNFGSSKLFWLPVGQ